MLGQEVGAFKMGGWNPLTNYAGLFLIKVAG